MSLAIKPVAEPLRSAPAERRAAKSSAAPANFTPPEIARRWRVNVDKILSLIRSGRLRAFDVAAPGSKRPRWRIPLDALLAFEAGQSPPPAPAPRRKRQPKGDVIEFF